MIHRDDPDGLRPLAVLSKHPNDTLSAKLSSHYVIMDTNIILQEIDVLEDANHGFKDVIVLQTVMQEVRHRSTAIYKRLKDIISDNKRRFYVFLNEHHKDCYAERLPGESANDRNDRAIRVASNWYSKHLKRSKISVVLISNDAENRRIASDEMSIITTSLRSYIENLKDSAALIDKLSSHSTEDNIDKSFGKELFSPHCTPAQINEGIKSGKFKQGIFYLSRTNFKEGTVNCESQEKPILIQGNSILILSIQQVTR